MAARSTTNGVHSKQSTPPNQTLYVQNLPPKITKQDLPLKTQKMRQQAHIVFREVNSASTAMRALQGTSFLGRDLRIQYAKGKSDTVAKLDGTYKMPVTATPQAEPVSTQLQKQVFGGLPAAPLSLPTVPPPPPISQTAATKVEEEREGTPQGVKRPREESDEEAAMEEDSDAPMEEDSDDD